MKHLLAAVALSLFALPATAEDFPVRRCINLGNALDTPSVEGEWGYIISTADFDAVKAAGFDTLRLPVRFSTRWDGTRIKPAFLRHVDALIRAALERDLNVILDLHHFTGLMENPAANAAAFQGIWTELSAHYAGWPKGLMFELLNEPEGAVSTAVAVQLYDSVLPVIRAAHPRRWVIVGGGEWNNLDEMLTLPQGEDFTASTFHYYEPFDFTHQQVAWNDPVLPARGWGSADDHAAVQAAMARAASRPGPVFLGEFGAARLAAETDRAAWLAEVRSSAEANGIGWCHWSFASDFGAYDPAARAWSQPVLAALTR